MLFLSCCFCLVVFVLLFLSGCFCLVLGLLFLSGSCLVLVLLFFVWFFVWFLSRCFCLFFVLSFCLVFALLFCLGFCLVVFFFFFLPSFFFFCLVFGLFVWFFFFPPLLLRPLLLLHGERRGALKSSPSAAEGPRIFRVFFLLRNALKSVGAPCQGDVVSRAGVDTMDHGPCCYTIGVPPRAALRVRKSRRAKSIAAVFSRR